MQNPIYGNRKGKGERKICLGGLVQSLHTKGSPISIDTPDIIISLDFTSDHNSAIAASISALDSDMSISDFKLEVVWEQ